MKKICNKCKVEKSLDDFYNMTKAKDGKTCECKECKKALNAKARINPESAKNKWGGGIYALVHKATCSIHYVGSAKRLYDRKQNHFNGPARCSQLVRNGKDPKDYEFVILNIIDNKEQRLKHEKLYIDILQPVLNKI